MANRAVVLDAFSRRIIGWAMGNDQKAQRVIDAMNMALDHCPRTITIVTRTDGVPRRSDKVSPQRKPDSVIHHSDQGSQYTSAAFGLRCKEMGVRPSMGSVGDCYDIAPPGRLLRNRLPAARQHIADVREGAVDGSYDAVRRYAATWSRDVQEASATAYVPLRFDPGEADEFDCEVRRIRKGASGAFPRRTGCSDRWCHNDGQSRACAPQPQPDAVCAGLSTRDPSPSRDIASQCTAGQWMVFDAHDKAFAFFGGACARGIYDSGNCPIAEERHRSE